MNSGVPLTSIDIKSQTCRLLLQTFVKECVAFRSAVNSSSVIQRGKVRQVFIVSQEKFALNIRRATVTHRLHKRGQIKHRLTTHRTWHYPNTQTLMLPTARLPVENKWKVAFGITLAYSQKCPLQWFNIQNVIVGFIQSLLVFSYDSFLPVRLEMFVNVQQI